MTTFAELGLSNNTLEALKKKGFENPTPIQSACIPILLTWSKDIVWQAQTGTGKTAAFALPIIEKVDIRNKQVQALILTPTRELAIQVAEDIASYKGDKNISIALLYGGASIGQQLGKLRQGAQIVVGTPGRVIDHIERWSLKLEQIKYFVLDEADEMLNMWFQEEIERILKSCNSDKQMLLFSATMPKEILKIAKTYMKEFDIVKIASQQGTTTNTEQIYLEVRERDKIEALSRIIDTESKFYAIIFCRTKKECEDLAQSLKDRWYTADAIHGDMNQRQREQVLNNFKKQNITILVATDVAARGIDVHDITHVINYHIPNDAESYTHRVGRTGRAGNKGIAITLVTPMEYRRLVLIKKITQTDIKKQAIPSIEEVKKAKLKNITQWVQNALESDVTAYWSLAQELTEKHDTTTLVAALLKVWFDEYMEHNQYRDIEQVSIDTSTTSRLFIAKGRAHGYMGPRELIKWLKDEADIQDKDISDIVVLEEFSFITCPFEVAEHILYIFRQKSSGKPLVKKARERDDKWSGWSRNVNSQRRDFKHPRNNRNTTERNFNSRKNAERRPRR